MCCDKQTLLCPAALGTLRPLPFQEACFYECDVNAGLFRRFPPGVFNASDPSHNTW